MDKKICKNCLIEKSISSFYKKTTTKDKLMSVCKICHKSKSKRIKPSKITDSNNSNHYKIHRTTKEDYLLMYDMLKLIGYDYNNGDIHQQFINKWNYVLDKNMKYKKRPLSSMNAYLPDGSLNMDNKKNLRNIEKQNDKKNPNNKSGFFL